MIQKTNRNTVIGLLFILFPFFATSVFAGILPTSPDLNSQVLSETVPSAFAPNDFEAKDFQLSWIGAEIPGVQVSLDPESLEWVRVQEVLVLPRGRLRVKAMGAVQGEVVSSGLVQQLSPDGTATVPVALMNVESNIITISVQKGAQTFSGAVRISFGEKSGGVYFDSSCSHFDTRAEFSPRLPAHQWMYVGCRWVREAAQDGAVSSLQLYVYWDGAANVPLKSVFPGTYLFQQGGSPGVVHLSEKSPDATVSIFYRMGDRFHNFNLGLGAGPYNFSFSGGGNSENTYTGEAMLYASYFITESYRIVSFGAFAFESSLTTDIGIYLSSESIRTLDRRIAINILLGAHALGFRPTDTYYLVFGAPQGAEAVFTDFLARGYNASAGAFIYPNINGVAYYNIWLRYGKGPVFLELNYINWTETISTIAYTSSSVGLSVGFPVAHLF